MPGIDISADQGDDVPGHWEFIVVKLSEGERVPNFRLGAQWRNAARTTRGVYHYARPALSSGTVQANYFCDQALAIGFHPGVDIWQLDAEAGENDGLSGATWRRFITDFMAVATARLGRRGFLYAGWPFLVGFGLTDLPFKFMWWLPDYGPDNSAVDHGLDDLPAAVRGLVVIHQFTSFGNLDQNKIINELAYAQPTIAPGGKTVDFRFNPPIDTLVDALVTSEGAWGLTADGGIFTFSGQFHGAPNGQAYFAGRLAARLVVPGTVVANANPPLKNYPASAVYEVIDTAGERYIP